jgi:hypothetical protein
MQTRATAGDEWVLNYRLLDALIVKKETLYLR